MNRRVRAFVPDLMDRSRLRSPGVDVEFVSDAAVLLDGPADLYVVDLSRPGAVAAVSCDVGSGRLVGFAPHVDDATMAEARSAGFDAVLARSTFFRRFPDV